MPERTCQSSVSGSAHCAPMPAEPENVIHRLAVGGDATVNEIVQEARTSDDVTTLGAAALLAAEPTGPLDRAAALALSTADRQVVAIAAAHFAGDAELVDALARDHLADHPTSV